MQKNKLILGLFVSLMLLSPKEAFAVSSSQVSITKLNSYVNTNNFKLSYSGMNSNPGAITAQFYYSKNGGTFTSFGPVINGANGQTTVTANEVNDETNYSFKVVINGGEAESSTSTIYDKSGPSGIGGYSKERINDGAYKLKWTNPGNTDFDKVVIYRGDSSDFSADSSHEIARVAGSPNSEMSYQDSFAPDAGKTYYYAIRALDKAANSSGLVGDGGTTTTVNSGSVAGATANGQVTVLPGTANGKSGSVLGEENKEEVSEVVGSGIDTRPGIIKWALTHKKITLIAAALAIALGYFLYRRKNN